MKTNVQNLVKANNKSAVNNDPRAGILQNKLFVNQHLHTTKFVVLKLVLARKVKIRCVNCNLHLAVVKVKIF